MFSKHTGGDTAVPKLASAIKGVVGEAVEANVVSVNIKPCQEQQCKNIAPYIPVMFAVCNLSTAVDVILCDDVVQQLQEMNAYNVLRNHSLTRML